jgi:hypothetical protein
MKFLSLIMIKYVTNHTIFYEQMIFRLSHFDSSLIIRSLIMISPIGRE